jgi:hypothetical protein
MLESDRLGRGLNRKHAIMIGSCGAMGMRIVECRIVMLPTVVLDQAEVVVT